MKTDQTTETFPLAVRAPKSSSEVKIYQTTNRGAASYILAYYADGRRQRETRAGLEEAKLRAMEISRDASKGIVASVALSTRQRDDYLAAAHELRGTGLTVSDAARRVAKAVSILGEDSIIEAVKFYKTKSASKLKPVPVADAVTAFVAVKRRNDKPGRRSYADDVERHLGLLAGVLKMHVSEVTAPDLRTFFDSLEVAPRTRNNIRASVSAFFTWCKKPSQRFLPGDWNEFDVEKANLGEGAIEIYSPKELQSLLDHAPAGLVPFIAIGAFAGLRADEIRKLNWKDVHLTRGHIEVTAFNAKTAARRLAPVTPNLIEWLKPLRKKAGPVWSHSRPYLYELLRATADKAKLTLKDNGLRHSFISYRVARKNDVAAVALEAGNSPKMIFQHYRELVTAEDAARWFAIAPAAKADAPTNIIALQAA